MLMNKLLCRLFAWWWDAWLWDDMDGKTRKTVVRVHSYRSATVDDRCGSRQRIECISGVTWVK